MSRKTYRQQLQQLQDQRAAEFERIGLVRRANRIRRCGAFAGPRGPWACKDRFCPACARKKAAEINARLRGLIDAMNDPITFVVKVISRLPTDLGWALDRVRAGLTELRRRAPFRTANPMVAVVEACRTPDGLRWDAHAHLIIEEGAVDLDDVDHLWRTATGGEGTVAIEKGRHWIYDPDAFCGYLSKRDDSAPDPGALDRDQLQVMVAALRGRRLFASWGTR
ncbi:MAG: hypothetical protein HY907_11490 [Deltaproteobacteria bacterium]|nr:hypothetical protein [Deltaproteobacteria bacterium]